MSNNVFIIGSKSVSDKLLVLKQLLKYKDIDVTEEQLIEKYMIPVEVATDLYRIDYKIDNKYYTSSINIYYKGSEKLTFTDQEKEILLTIQAIILLYDINSPTLIQYNNVLSFSEQFDPSIKIVILNKLKDSNNIINDGEALKWCLDNSYELVTLLNIEPLPVASTSGNLLGDEKLGMERVLESLECHIWPDCEFKQPANNTNPNYMDELSESDEEKDMEGKEEKDEDHDSGNEMNEADLDDFEAMLEQVASVRRDAANLSDEERRERATQMIMKLMKL